MTGISSVILRKTRMEVSQDRGMRMQPFSLFYKLHNSKPVRRLLIGTQDYLNPLIKQYRHLNCMNYELPFSRIMTTNKWYFSGEQSVTGIKRKITCLILRVLILAPTLFSSLFTLTCVAGGMLWVLFWRRSLERVESKSRK